LTLKEKLMADYKIAMREKDQIKKNTVSLARAAIKQYEIDNRVELEDKDIVPILQKQVKMRKDALADFEKAGRTDLLESYNAEIKVLEEYLPEMLSSDAILKVVEEVALGLGIEGGKENIGKLMGPVMAKVKGLAGGNEVREAIQKFLG
jgi:uncharacterized protein YqeY